MEDSKTIDLLLERNEAATYGKRLFSLRAALLDGKVDPAESLYR